MIPGVCEYMFQGNITVRCKHFPTIGLLPDSRAMQTRSQKCQGITEFPGVSGEIGILETHCVRDPILELYVVHLHDICKTADFW